MKKISSFVVVMFILTLSACESSKNYDLYYWGDYPDYIYSYAKQDFMLSNQINNLEKIINQAKAKKKAVPPGLRAHLAVLYLQIGNDQQADFLLEQEKLYFPESATFIDFQRKGLTKVKTNLRQTK